MRLITSMPGGFPCVQLRQFRSFALSNCNIYIYLRRYIYIHSFYLSRSLGCISKHAAFPYFHAGHLCGITLPSSHRPNTTTHTPTHTTPHCTIPSSHRSIKGLPFLSLPSKTLRWMCGSLETISTISHPKQQKRNTSSTRKRTARK